MPELAAIRHAPVGAGLAALAACIAAALLMPSSWRETLRENAFDQVLAIDAELREPAASPAPIVVVDIDRRSIEALGPWPWGRDTMARLVEAVAAAKPAVIAIDVLFADPDSRSPAALARQLGALTGRADITTLADDLPDGDKRLAAALRTVPSVLGFVLTPDPAPPLPGVPIAMRGALPIDQLWREAGGVGPVPDLIASVQGLGTLSLAGDADGSVRAVPLFVGAGETLLPGFALEIARLARGAGAYLIQAEPPLVTAGELALALPRQAMMRMPPPVIEQHAGRTVSALDVIEGRADARLAGATVLIGGSAPELGGLRETASDPLTPSVQIQADAVAQIMTGRVPRTLEPATWVGLLLIGLAGAVALVAGCVLSPALGAFVLLAAVALMWVGAVAASLLADRLVDPLAPSLAAAVVFVVAAGTSYATTRRRAALVRRRFEQHLAPAVVRRIVDEPGLMKLGGERREVTALFTDVEGFTALTHRATPEALVAVLDDYFEGVASIVVQHGGMVDKIVGDGVHAFFNAPIDLADHPRRAIDCASALRAWTHAYRAKPEPAALGFGRTRIGIETGMVIVGDVGLKAKLDYTAHGDAVNAAARLEAANKELGSDICIGPTAAARCDAAMLRPLGSIGVRGRDDEILAVFEPWPDDAMPAWRERYLTACAAMRDDRAQAAALFDTLAAERPDDPVPRRMAERLRAVA
jgi:adenylate cyclase